MSKGATVLAAVTALALLGACEEKKSSKDSGSKGDAGAQGGPDAGTTDTDAATMDTDAGDTAPDDQGCVRAETTPAAENNGITLPDSLCTEDKCEVGGCDPKGATQPACNAWLLEGKVSFQGVKVGPQGTFGLPPAPAKTDDDTCPGLMSAPRAADENCCQRATQQGSEPAFKLTGLALSRPRAFAAPPVAENNKTGIENDLYNWIFVLNEGADLSKATPGTDLDIKVTTGNAWPNTDGSFTPLKGPIASGGMTFNADGAWDAHPGIAGKLSTKDDGTHTLCMGPTEPLKDVVMARWFDDSFNFVQMQLHMAGITWEVPFSKDMLCAGLHSDAGFDLVGELHAFLPVEGAKNTGLYFAPGGQPLNLCGFISGAQACDGPAGTWKP